MGRKIALIGGGGFAKEVAELVRLRGDEIAGCYAADPGHFAALHKGYLDELDRDKAHYDAVALGVGAFDRRSLKRRQGLTEWILASGLPAPAVVSPTAILAEGVTVEDGAFVGHGVNIGVDATIRGFAVVNMGAILGHDAVVGERSVVAPGAFVGGGSTIGRDTIIGPLAKVLQGISIGDDVMLGIGCLALRSLGAGSTVWPRPERTT
jgi:sugar O-acyltransferase (sialic acid O-acetyltransferase NeuD family)